MEKRRDVLRAWFLLFRPWSYVATLVPFCVAADLVPAGTDAAIAFHPSTGALSVTAGGRVVWQSGRHGLWRLAFRDGATLASADFATNAVPGGTFTVATEGGTTRLAWRSPQADVTVTAQPVPDGRGVDLRAAVTPKRGESLMLDFPARLDFPADSVHAFVYPGRGNDGLGLALNAKFFQPSTPEQPRGWTRARTYDAGYRHLFGGGLRQMPLNAAAPQTLIVTPEGTNWFSAAVLKRLAATPRPVLRASTAAQCDLVLVDSANGPYLGATRFGGTGALWRFGVADTAPLRKTSPGQVDLLAVKQLLPRLAAQAPMRRRVALIALSGGPACGDFSGIPVAAWRAALREALPAGCTFEDVATVPALKRLLSAPDALCILNPYGEAFPVETPADYIPQLDALRAFVKAGGNWIEVGGYSFYHAFYASGFLSLKTSYPPLFADFAQLATTHGDRVALYGLQPRGTHAPWKNPAPFTPGETQVGADAAGGWYVHAFAAYAKPGETVRTPAVRLRTGDTLEAALADYAAANGLTTPLAAKVRDPATLEKLKRAPLLKVSAPAVAARKMLAACPAPTLYHPPNYLKGGFDKEYPDHLPPNARYGTMNEMAALFRDLRAQGHLVSPYTNPTWWCDHPRGPSFVAAGEAPLAIGLDGKPYHEVYARNDGWTTTFWHPAVQAANRETVRAFTQDAPVDLLFQDQCGARGWRWDFNPASPSPMAYTEGLLSMNAEDARRAPLGTEDGWDHTANYQTALCGCTWRTVPLEPSLRPLYKTEIPADSWRIEPVALRLFHDKALFYMHDLGAFVTNERVLAWMLALGYNLSYVAVGDFVGTPQFAWYTWLHELQARVVSRIAGQPLVAFRHDRAPLLARRDLASFADPRDDGVVAAQWGDVSVCVNLGDVPRTVGGRALAPYGWWIEGPGLTSGHLAGEAAFIETPEGRRTWGNGEFLRTCH